MWCTRWFIPLFLLPLPTAPPFFLVLLLFSLTIHARPCFYCIVLLGTLFLSSCYWQPFPLDTPLSKPWTDNITTFGEALNASLSASSYWESSHAKPLPSVVHPVDRCWCDFASGNFFDPFNTSDWESVSIKRTQERLDRQLKQDEGLEASETNTADQKQPESTPETQPLMPKTASQPTPTPLPWMPPLTRRLGFVSIRPHFWRFVQTLRRPGSDSLPRTDSSTIREQGRQGSLPILRKEYDLRPYGVGMFIDFNWSR